MTNEEKETIIRQALTRSFLRGVSYGMSLVIKSEGYFEDLSSESLARIILSDNELNSVILRSEL